MLRRVLETIVDSTAVVRAFYAAFNAGDLDALIETVDPRVVFVPVLGILYESNVYRGRAGIAAWYRELERRWDGFDAHIEDVREIGGTVIAFLRLVAHQGDRELEARIAVECRVRAGRIYRIRGRDLVETAEELGVSFLAA
jgi:ketosteroid isomerase-like protein